MDKTKRIRITGPGAHEFLNAMATFVDTVRAREQAALAAQRESQSTDPKAP